MKLTYLTSLASAALLIGCGIASAQTTYSTPAKGSADTPMSSPADTSKGNDLDTTSKSPKVNTTSAPPTSGQDKSTGNNMVSPNGTEKTGDIKEASAARPDFSTLDTKKSGKLTAADVKSNQWLSKNFSKCDTDHDGSVDKTEYEACH
jgi:hypothetical protein